MNIQEKLYLFMIGKIKKDKEIKQFIKEIKIWNNKKK